NLGPVDRDDADAALVLDPAKTVFGHRASKSSGHDRRCLHRAQPQSGPVCCIRNSPNLGSGAERISDAKAHWQIIESSVVMDLKFPTAPAIEIMGTSNPPHLPRHRLTAPARRRDPRSTAWWEVR